MLTIKAHYTIFSLIFWLQNCLLEGLQKSRVQSGSFQKEYRKVSPKQKSYSTGTGDKVNVMLNYGYALLEGSV